MRRESRVRLSAEMNRHGRNRLQRPQQSAPFSVMSVSVSRRMLTMAAVMLVPWCVPTMSEVDVRFVGLVGPEESAPSSSAENDAGVAVAVPVADQTGVTSDELLEELMKVERQSADSLDDGIFDPISPDPSCSFPEEGDVPNQDCYSPPQSTVETANVLIDVACAYGGDDPDTSTSSTTSAAVDNIEGLTTPSGEEGQCGVDETGKQRKTRKEIRVVDKHWGSDAAILKMRDILRNTGVTPGAASPSTSEEGGDDDTNQNKQPHADEKKQHPHDYNRRPPIFLMPGLASTRLVAWRPKACSSHPLLSDIKVQDYVWMNMNLLLQMATLDATCWKQCMTLGLNQTDMNDVNVGCKLRPDEGLDAISSLAPGSLSSNLLVGGTNTVYAWLTQWLADNLGYDVTSIIGLPYDWRLSPDVMEKRDGFLTLTRKRIEAAVKSNGEPGIMVAHSMGNAVFRYFLEWLRSEMREEAYIRYVKRVENRAAALQQNQARGDTTDLIRETTESMMPGWMGGVPRQNAEGADYGVQERMYSLANSVVTSFDDWWRTYFDKSDNAQMKKGAETAMEFEDAFTKRNGKHSQLWELAQMEGDAAWLEWIEGHIWTYVGLSAPLLGAINPLRAVISGENMGLPITDEVAREMELTFGATHTVNVISTKMGFCDGPTSFIDGTDPNRNNLACLDELVSGIEESGNGDKKDPWENFEAMRLFLKERVDWDTDFPMISINLTTCEEGQKSPCTSKSKINISPRDVQSGDIFRIFKEYWKEHKEPMKIKREQLEASWWSSSFPNPLNTTWDRPHIKHVIMAYGVDVPTEVGYVYKKEKLHEEAPHSSHTTQESSEKQKDNAFDGIPNLQKVIWEEANGILVEENMMPEPKKSLTESVLSKKKPKKRPLNGESGKGTLGHSGDGTIPYLSLAWAHTWLLHATRAMTHSGQTNGTGERISDYNALDAIKVSYRPKGASDWVERRAKNRNDKSKGKGDSSPNSEADDETDTGTMHPHGTKYKPAMLRYQSTGRSRRTKMEYTTTVIEAIGVEHKETTRNYDILAAVFTDVLKHMHDDFGLV